MSGVEHQTGRDRLRSFVDRILRLKEEQDAISGDIREVYAEAKAEGFDKTAMGQLVGHLRKIEKSGADAVQEASAVFDTYLHAYQSSPSRAHACEEARQDAEPAEPEPTPETPRRPNLTVVDTSEPELPAWLDRREASV
jgi:uncharacterized protein (UPF0335 family)